MGVPHLITAIDVLNAGKAFAEQLGIVGLVDVRINHDRSTGYVGKPGGDDFLIEIRISRMEPVDG